MMTRLARVAAALLAACAVADAFAPGVTLPGLARPGWPASAVSAAAGVRSARARGSLRMRTGAGAGGAGEAGDAGAVSSRVRRALLQTAIAAPLVLGSAAPGEAAAGAGQLVLVVGATGGIGQYAILELLARGYKVRGISRRVETVKQQVKGTDLEKVEWVSGDLNDKSIFAPAMMGVNKVIIAAGAHGWEDIENNRRIYAEAVGEIARIGAQEKVDRIALISSAGLDRVKPSYSDYLKDVLKWKQKGERLLKASGVPYSIIRAYSLNNEADDVGDDYTVAVFQGDPDGVAALITRKDLGEVAAEAVIAESTKDTTFEVCNARKDFMGMEPDWRKSLKGLSPDPPLSPAEKAAAKMGSETEKVLKKEDTKDKNFYGDPSKGFRN